MTGPTDTHRVRVRPARGHRRYTHTDNWQQPDVDELEALPVGTRRTVILNGVWLTVTRKPDGWTIAQRHRVSSRVLAGRWSVPTALTPPPRQ